MNERQKTNLSDGSHSQSSSSEDNQNPITDSMVVQRSRSPRPTPDRDQTLPDDIDSASEHETPVPGSDHRSRSQETVAGMLTAQDPDATSPRAPQGDDASNAEQRVASPRGRTRVFSELDDCGPATAPSDYHINKKARFEKDIEYWDGVFQENGESSGTATVTDNERTNEDDGNTGSDENLYDDDSNDAPGNDAPDNGGEEEVEEEASSSSHGSHAADDEASEGHAQGPP